jgi:hypothetical protein
MADDRVPERADEYSNGWLGRMLDGQSVGGKPAVLVFYQDQSGPAERPARARKPALCGGFFEWPPGMLRPEDSGFWMKFPGFRVNSFGFGGESA